MLKSKKEILQDHEVYLKFVGMGNESDLFEAMDEYAKQQAIAFRNWEPPIGNYNSDEDLYEIFEQSKVKP